MWHEIFSFTPRNSRLILIVVSANQNWKLVCVFLCHGNMIKSCQWWHCLFFVIFLQQFNLKMFRNKATSDTDSTPTPCTQHLHNLWILVVLVRFSGFVSTEFLILRILLLRCPFRHLHEILPLVDVITSGSCIPTQSGCWTYMRTALPHSFPNC